VKLLLFDIDGTLVLTGGAGQRGWTRAFKQVFGVDDALSGVQVQGRTDPAILEEVLQRAAIDADATARRTFLEQYLPLLAEELEKPVPAALHSSQHSHHKGPLPGVLELVRVLQGRDDVFLSLLTGNYTRAAKIKLGYFDLWRPFRCGAFGDDAALRHELVPIAADRARALGCPPVSPDEVIVVGDTPLDVDCAKKAGVRVVAVATGGYSPAALREAGADSVLESFADTSAVVEHFTAAPV